MDRAPQPTLVVVLEDIANPKPPAEVWELWVRIRVQLETGTPVGIENRGRRAEPEGGFFSEQGGQHFRWKTLPEQRAI